MTDLIQVMSLVLGGAVIGLSLFVLRLYWYANRLLRAQRRPVPGALPYHVWLISTSHLVLVGTTVWLSVTHDHWYIATFCTAAYATSIVSLVDMLRYQQSRIHAVLKGTMAKSTQLRRGGTT